ncbi:putative nucleotidyltransferase with HDIG domain [Natranaerovirga hydrolytica]|uniref:Putative nucleotidyltransferase with HDIG domain n=1 Tax=Natranaerovirga hydrolytica TaxID=680378 RepID=A0A4R1MPJ2_9FIRM|nr:HD domain-containing protein [Natranaerovirga hydrolytica]TCK92399.1 putative nucleotidyltransferase with HDIG domain [Natranaerovirga hydrolytica]
MDKHRYFIEFDKHLLNDEKPSHYFNELVKTNAYPIEEPLIQVLKLKQIEQNTIHHPEGNVWNHTMLVIDNAAILKPYSQDKRVMMWGALLHDIGKLTTTKVRKGKITAYNHDKEGEEQAEAFLSQLTEDTYFINKVKKLVRWHMQPLFVAKNLPFAQIKAMLQEVEASEIGLFSLCDRLGRGDTPTSKQEEQKKAVIKFLETSKQYAPSYEVEKINQVIDVIKTFKQM